MGEGVPTTKCQLRGAFKTRGTNMMEYAQWGEEI